MPEPDVIATLSRDSNNAILDEQRSRGPHLFDFPKAFEALDVSAMSPMKTTEALPVDGGNAFWLSEDRARVVVDERRFSDLTVVTAFMLDPYEQAIVGTHRLTDTPPLTIATLLITADVIHTWAHIGSELAMSNERIAEDGTWSVDVRGSHVYFTNEENEDPVNFTVHIDPQNQISVTGLPRR